MYSRRHFGRITLGTTALAGLPLSMTLGATGNSATGGVRLGATTYSLRDLHRIPGKDNVDDVIKPLRFSGVSEIDLWSYNTEPAGPDTGPAAPPPPAAYPVLVHKFTPEEITAAMLATRNALREWRLGAPASYYEAIRDKFAAAGIGVAAYTVNYDDRFTDEEIDVTFRQARALGVASITASGSPEMIKRVAPFAEKHQLTVSLTDFSLTSSLSSKYLRLNLDIGQLTAANGSPVAYILENDAAISQITVKDRRRNHGANEQFGDGDTPIRDVLRLVKEKKYTFPVFAEYEYTGLGTPAEELKKCMDYMRSAVG